MPSTKVMSFYPTSITCILKILYGLYIFIFLIHLLSSFTSSHKGDFSEFENDYGIHDTKNYFFFLTMIVPSSSSAFTFTECGDIHFKERYKTTRMRLMIFLIKSYYFI